MKILLLACMIVLLNAKKIDDILAEFDEEEADVHNGVTELKSTSFRQMLKEDKFTFVLFYDPTCPHCKQVIPKYEQLGLLMKNNNKTSIARLNCDTYHSFCLKLTFVKGYPSLFLIHKDIVYPEYKMSFSPEAMKDWIEYMIGHYNNNNAIEEKYIKTEL